VTVMVMVRRGRGPAGNWAAALGVAPAPA
jgi:hypothetical protein